MNSSFAPFQRLGRYILWRCPSFYRVFGIVRHRRDCRIGDFDLWIDGFPRSAQTFATKSFQLANPDAKIRSHQHLPPFIINAIQTGKPGILMMRKPADAAISWAIYWDNPVGLCLDYYIDFHRTLLPYTGKMFIARFEEVTYDFGSLVQQFNQQVGTHYNCPSHDPGTVFSLIEAETNWHDPELDSRRICRPSPERARIKALLMKELTTSSKIAKKLDKARRLYYAIAGGQPLLRETGLSHDTKQLPV